MVAISRAFLMLAVISAGFALVWAQVLPQGAEGPAQGHLTVLGWIGFAVFAIYYRIVPEAQAGRLAQVQFWTAVVGIMLLIPGVALAAGQVTELAAQLGAQVLAVSALLFGAVVLTN